jgi:glycosyltransferase involved in cell wall biosynthesis
MESVRDWRAWVLRGRERKKLMSTVTAAIVINNRNNAAFIRACVDSALAQTRAADEVIVYDDASDDGAREILRGYGDRIVLIEGEDDGRWATPRLRAANAIHQGVLRSKAAWIFLLDGDDCFLERKLERYLDVIEKEDGLSLVQAPMLTTDACGVVTGEYREGLFHGVEDHWAETRRRRDCDLFYPTSAMAVHRRVLERELPLDFSVCPYLASDFRIAALALYHGKAVTLEEPLTCWRRHGGSISLRNSASRWYLLRVLTARARVFNYYARQRGRRPIAWWTNSRVWRRLAGALLRRRR